MNDTYTQILERLAIYKFLSVSQFERLWVAINRKTLYDILSNLRKDPKKLIDKTSFRYNPKYGRVEDMHFLTPKAKKHLINEHGQNESDINMPIGNSLFYKDYQHRKRTIDVHIAMRTSFESLGADIIFYNNYFSGKKKNSGRGRETATKINLWDWSIRADSIFMARFFPNWNLLFCVEVHQGHRVKKICDQLLQYTEVLAKGSVSSKYWLKVGCRVLVIFEHHSTLQSTVERLKKHPKFKFLYPYFLFKTYSACMHNPLQWWQRIDDTRNDL